jgi:hypothetical protein
VSGEQAALGIVVLIPVLMVLGVEAYLWFDRRRHRGARPHLIYMDSPKSGRAKNKAIS